MGPALYQALPQRPLTPLSRPLGTPGKPLAGGQHRDRGLLGSAAARDGVPAAAALPARRPAASPPGLPPPSAIP